MNMVTSNNNDLAEKLKEYRRLANFSQESLAATSGISIRTIQRMEAGGSVGSAYTLEKLATALGIHVSELIREQIPVVDAQTIDNNRLNIINLSALSVILLPFFNIALPLVILLKSKGNTALSKPGRRIISFQILWTLGTLVLIILIPLFLLLFRPLRGGSIPMSIPVYYACVAVNVYYTLKCSIAINKQEPFFNRIPNIL